MATGFFLSNSLNISISNNTISYITGGQGGNGGVNTGTGGAGGLGAGIYLSGSSNNTIKNNDLSYINGGQGGIGGGLWGSGGRGGLGAGIYFTSSILNNLTDNNIDNIIGGSGGIGGTSYGEKGADGGGYGIFLNSDSYNNNILLSNTLDNDPIVYLYNQVDITIEGYTFVSSNNPTNLGKIALIQCTYIKIINNDIANYHGLNGSTGNVFSNGASGGIGAGVYLLETSNSNISNNEIYGIQGSHGGTGGSAGFGGEHGGAGGSSAAIYLTSSSYNLINDNKINVIKGGKGGNGGCGSGSGGSGSISGGIISISSTNNQIANNILTQITGGDGGNGGHNAGGGGGGSGGVGGAGAGSYFSSSSNNTIYNNTIDNIMGGQGGDGDWGTFGGAGGAGGAGAGIFYSLSFNNSVKNITVINIIGGNGGEGSEAAAGGSEVGGAGGSGGNGICIYFSSSYDNKLFNSTISSPEGGDGGNGGNGGGGGGDGGAGGNGGNGTCIYFSDSYANYIDGNFISNAVGGQGGTGGSGGGGGSSGSNGVDGIGIGIFINSNSNYNIIYYNNIEGNDENGNDNGNNNNWDDGFSGNYWDDYSGDDINPIDGIGDSSYSILGTANANDTKPLFYSINLDTDSDGLKNYEEYTLGIDEFRTNVTTPDSENDGISDYWEWRNGTNPWNPDTDFDTIWDIDEILGSLGYTTNATNPDTDYDGLRDDYEYGNNTLPLDPDTDNDNLLDGDEILGTLGYITNATNFDTDYDGLRDDYEYGNNTLPLDPDTDNDNVFDGEECTIGFDGYITNATNIDTDGDSFNDGVEFNLNTNPINRWWYPMPNLNISSFSVSDVYEGQPFVLDFTIQNTGIWEAKNIRVLVRCDALVLTIYDNIGDSFNLTVNESERLLIDCSEISTPGAYVLTLRVDPYDLINETYSSKNGNINLLSENDNSEPITMQIIAGQPPATIIGDGDDSGGSTDTSYDYFPWIILTVIGITTVSGILIVKRRVDKNKKLNVKKVKAKNELSKFEQKMRNFIEKELKGYYKDEWWEQGIPNYIRDIIETELRTKLIKDPPLKLENIDLLELSNFYPIISEKRNWKKIFSNTYSLLKNIEGHFEKLTNFKTNFYQKRLAPVELKKYPHYMYHITKYFSKEVNIFLSYSTLDSDYFQIHEIAKQLGEFPEIDKVFIWEIDSGEDIVDYMERTLNMSKVFVLFCSENAMNSQAVEDEWKAAFQLRKRGLMEIIPVYENEDFIPSLLTPLLIVEFTKDNLKEFIQKLYQEIKR